MNITVNLIKQALPCLWLSFELTLKELWKKFIAMGADENFLCYAPLKTTSGRIDWIRLKIKEAILKFNVKVIFIDHLGFILPEVEYDKEIRSNYSVYLTMVCRQLINIAKNENVIIFLMGHVRKTSEELDTDDLAHSAGIAQEATFVYMIEPQKEKRGKFSLKNPNEEDLRPLFTKIKLVKNRRTGQRISALYEFVNNWFTAYDR